MDAAWCLRLPRNASRLTIHLRSAVLCHHFAEQTNGAEFDATAAIIVLFLIFLVCCLQLTPAVRFMRRRKFYLPSFAVFYHPSPTTVLHHKSRVRVKLWSQCGRTWHMAEHGTIV